MAKAPKGDESDVLTEASEAFRLLDFKSQQEYVAQLQGLMEENRAAKIAELQAALAALGVEPARTAAKKATGEGRGNRTSPKPKYRSKANPDLVWSGRGQRAKWLSAEMEETGKPLDYFLIDGE